MIGFVLFVWALVNIYFRTFVFMKVWNWIPHTILNVPQIGMIASFGLLIVLMFFKPLNFLSKKEKKDEALDPYTSEEKLKRAFLVSMVHANILLIGYLISLSL